jgi:hypothetical protein
LALILNISDNHTYKKFTKIHMHTLARRFGIDD